MSINFRNSLSKIVAKMFILLGFVNKSKKRALNGDYILSIYFHKPSKEEFESIVIWLKGEGFSFIDLETLLLVKEKKLPFPKGAVLITVDDGWASNVNNMAKVASFHQVPITIFVATEAIQTGDFWMPYAKLAKNKKLGYPSAEEMKKLPNFKRLEYFKQLKKLLKIPREAMTIAQLQEIAKIKFVKIGAHSHSHPILIQCTEQEVLDECSFSKDLIESWINTNVDFFAYPNGDYGNREISILKKLNYKMGFTTTPKPLEPHHLNNPFSIPRIGLLEGASFEENICRIMGVWHNNTFKIFKK